MRPLFRLITGIVLAYFLAVFILTFVYLLVPPVSTVMMASAVRGDGMHRQWVPLSRVAPVMVRSVIAAEDGQFCNHHGIDWKAVDKVVTQAQRTGRASRGASTITMQVARNLFLLNTRSYVRKALEAPLALWIDWLWPKRRIMEVYLNIAEWGDGVFGIEQASRTAFGIPAASLNAYQASMLTVVLPDPTGRSAARPGSSMRLMASLVERRAGGASSGCTR